MATVSEEIALTIIANDGYYEDDPRVSKVVKYDNDFGGVSYAIVYPHEHLYRYEESPCCRNVQTLWQNSV